MKPMMLTTDQSKRSSKHK